MAGPEIRGAAVGGARALPALPRCARRAPTPANAAHIKTRVTAARAMDETSALFREQAGANLRIAQMIPRHDLSGHALGLSLFHAQQCIEMQLKAIVLKLNEEMEFEKGDKFLFDLSHQFYPTLHEIRERFLNGLDAPPELARLHVGLDTDEHAFERNGNIIAHMGAFWREYLSSDPPIHEYMWKNSLHVRLAGVELDALNGFSHDDTIALCDALECQRVGDLAKKQFSNDFPPVLPMRDVIGNRLSIERAYKSYALNLYNQEIQACVDRHMARQDLVFSGTASGRLGRLDSGRRRQATRLLVAEFGFQAAASQAYRYIFLFPHNTRGRYHKCLPGGGTTAGIYESRQDIVLHRVYNETRLNFGLLCRYFTKLDEMCRLCRERGYW